MKLSPTYAAILSSVASSTVARTDAERSMLRSIARRIDEVGSPATEAEYPAPDGTTVMLPTWVIAQLQELQTLKAAGGAAPPTTDRRGIINRRAVDSESEAIEIEHLRRSGYDSAPVDGEAEAKFLKSQGYG